jgi:DNA-binding transcriptional ArsR family regulator
MIPERQEALDWLVRKYLTKPAAPNGRNGHAPEIPDERIVELCRKAKNAAKFSDLFDAGDTSAYGSASEADMALASIISFYTQDAGQIERLISDSALGQREKWRRRADYRRHTIEGVLASVGETYGPSASSSSSRPLGENDDDANRGLVVKKFRDLPKFTGPRPEVVKGLVPERFPTTIHGDGGSAKSVIALSIAQALARGADNWCGHKIERQRSALLVDFELDQEEQSRRALQIARGDGLGDSPEGVYYLSAIGHRTADVFEAALAACDDHKVEVVIIDSVGLALEGDPSDPQVVISFFRALDAFRAKGVTVVLVDHQAKLGAGENYQSKSAFGSVYKGNLTRSRIQVEVKERCEGVLRVVTRQVKANFAGLAEPFAVKIAFSEEMITLEREDLGEEELREELTLNASDRILLALLDGPTYPEDLVEPTGVTIGTVGNTLTALRKRGLVEPTGERRGKAQEVALTEKGKQHVRDFLERRSSSSRSLKDDDDDDAPNERLWRERRAEMEAEDVA